MARRSLCLALAVAAFSPLWQTAAATSADTRAPEFSVKAAYLYKFGGFVEWPQSAFTSAGGTTNLCILGDDPFGDVLDKVVNGQRIADHPVAVVRLKTVTPKSACQILYIGGADEQKASAALEAVRGENVLTITDGANTPQTTGIINFVIADNRVRFEIDDQAASVNGVTISSKLLDLARSTKRRG